MAELDVRISRDICFQLILRIKRIFKTSAVCPPTIKVNTFLLEPGCFCVKINFQIGFVVIFQRYQKKKDGGYFLKTPFAGEIAMSEAALQFLQKHGNTSVVSLGCGKRLNRLDNHIKLMVQCQLDYYVAIDRVADIEFDLNSAFAQPNSGKSILSAYFDGNLQQFMRQVKLFPNTCVEELAGIQCQVVVCQRVLPFRHWEGFIESMNPALILQEDLHGCELQMMSGKRYKKSYPGIIHYQLQTFRPSRIIPGERNIILWRRRDFYPCREDLQPWWKRLIFRICRRKFTTSHACR